MTEPERHADTNRQRRSGEIAKITIR